jgi:hypothetical protein
MVLNANENLKFSKLTALDDVELSKKINKDRLNRIKKFAFCALSQTPENILMWSHYAEAHTGFVLELEFPDIENDHHFQKVGYVPTLPEFDLDKFAKFLMGDDKLFTYLFKDISIKSSEWNYEEEWRIWRANPAYYFYTKEQVKGIYFGINCAFDTKAAVYELTSYLGKDFLYTTMEFQTNPVRLTY